MAAAAALSALGPTGPAKRPHLHRCLPHPGPGPGPSPPPTRDGEGELCWPLRFFPFGKLMNSFVVYFEKAMG